MTSVTMAINFQPSCECIRLTFLKLFAVSFSCAMVFLLFITFVPSNVKFHITEASLTMFNLKSNITSRNPNKNMAIYHRAITTVAWCENNDFARANSSSFDQGHKNTTFLNVASEGKGVIELKPEQLLEHNEETPFGIYKEFARVNLSSFDQGYKSPTYLYIVFERNSVIKPIHKQLFEYFGETCLGIYNESFFDL